MTPIPEMFALALRHHQAGNLHEAERLYRQILQTDPRQADTHHLLGVLASQLGRHEEAIALIRQAVAMNPREAVYYSNLGTVHEALGDTAEAVASYRQALGLQPDYADAHNNLGNALSSQAKLEEAVTHYHHALRIRPDFAEARNGLGNALLSQGKSEEAVAQLQQVLRARPTSYEVHNNLGNALLSQGKLEEAVTFYHQALRIRPESPEAHNNLGNALLEQGKSDQAVACYRHALRLRPNFAETCNSLGIALQLQDKLDEAIGCFMDALRLKPSFAAAWTNLANLRRDQGRFDEALAGFEQALRHDPGRAEIHHNRALLWLLLGNWSQGWPEFEWRWQTKDFPRYAFRQPRWDGSPLAGRTILLVAEQGLGDTLQFIRYVPLIQQRGGRVILLCQAPLQRLLVDCWGRAQVVAQGAPLPEFDVYAPLVSLPGILGTSPTNVPTDVPYLHADAKLVEHWKSRKSEVGSRKSEEMHLTSDFRLPTSDFLVGIAWQGKPTYRHDRQRSIPLKHFARLAEVPGVQLISLQKGPGAEQLSALAGQIPVLDVGTHLDEASGAFMDTAAIMKNLDLVISSDTAIGHLAGALSVPVWVALPVAPDWRWLLQREDSPWYPTMRLFRQARYGDWDEVFQRMAKALVRLRLP